MTDSPEISRNVVWARTPRPPRARLFAQPRPPGSLRDSLHNASAGERHVPRVAFQPRHRRCGSSPHSPRRRTPRTSSRSARSRSASSPSTSRSSSTCRSSSAISWAHRRRCCERWRRTPSASSSSSAASACRTSSRSAQLARSGEMQQDANMGGGQMKAADFVMTAAVQVSDPNAGGVGGAVGGMLGRKNPVLGAVGGGVKFKDAQTSILVSDARTTVQVAAAEGKARKTSFSLGAIGYRARRWALAATRTRRKGRSLPRRTSTTSISSSPAMKGDADMMARADKFKPTGLSGADVKAGCVVRRRRRSLAQDRQREGARGARGRRAHAWRRSRRPTSSCSSARRRTVT